MNDQRIYRIYVSAGHGYYFNQQYQQWMTQRRSYWDVVEDTWNVLVAKELFNLLDEDQRFQVSMNRDLFNEETGVSGRPKFMEGSHLFFKEVGAPEWVWNNGVSVNQAINADAAGAKFNQTDIAISIHANSGGGEARGHEVWHHSNANLGKKLAGVLNDTLIALPNPPRGLKYDSQHDQYAFWKETQGKIMSLVEYFFYDNTIDNELMKQQSNVTLCAQLTYQGIINFIETYGRSIPLNM
jgi:N-acetylmuramoyl-L-alanine amidase